MIKTVLLILLIFVAIAIAMGPGLRRFFARLLGLPYRDR